MAVEQLGITNEGLGFETSFEAHVLSHELNTKQILNIAEKRKKTDPRPPYNPHHADNQWPLQVHRADGTKDIGISVLGVTNPEIRARILKENKEALQEAIQRDGYRREPFLKPQVEVLSPAAEKAAMLAKQADLQAQIAGLQDQNLRILEAIQRGTLITGSATATAPAVGDTGKGSNGKGKGADKDKGDDS